MDKLIELLLVFAVLIVFIGGLWIWPIFLGIKAAREKQRSPHWMWFGIHPVGGWIALAVLRSLKPLQPGDSADQEVDLLPQEIENHGAILERQRWFWVLWFLCFLAQVCIGVLTTPEPAIWPWPLILFAILFLATGLSLFPLMWFILGDYKMNKLWLSIGMIHPVLLVIPVAIRYYQLKKSRLASSA